MKYLYSRKEIAKTMVKDINSVYGATLVAMLFAKKESAPPIEPVSEDKTVEGKIPEKFERTDDGHIPYFCMDLLAEKIEQIIDYLSSNAKTK